MELNSQAALLVMDVQQGVVRATGAEHTPVLERIRSALDTARSRKIPVLFTAVDFRQGHPEVSPRNKQFSGMAGAGAFVRGTDDTAIHPAVEAKSGEALVTKLRVSAF